MKLFIKVICGLLVCVFCITVVSCDDRDMSIDEMLQSLSSNVSNDQNNEDIYTETKESEAKTPSSSSMLKGQNYEDVVKIFEDNGFTNIKLEKIEDLIFGWLTKEGDVEEVYVGGDSSYSSDKWVPNNIEVIIKYHTFPAETNEASTQEQQSETSAEVNDVNLTAENCTELSNILSMKAESDPAYIEFAEKYKGKTIEFDGRIDYITNYKEYNTRYDILVSAGDYNSDSQIGPTFKFENVAAHNLDLDTLYLEEALRVGMNVRIVAKIKSYNPNSFLFFLEPVSVSGR